MFGQQEIDLKHEKGCGSDAIRCCRILKR